MMSRLHGLQPLISVIALSITFAATPVLADQEVVDAVNSASKQDMMIQEKLNDALVETIKGASNTISDAQLKIQTDNAAREMLPHPMTGVSFSLGSYQRGQLISKAAAQTTEYNILRLLERMETPERTPFEIDSSLDVNAQAFDIFMRYFCDPTARSGTQEGKTYRFDNFNVAGTNQSYEVGCGTATGGVESRTSLIGSDPTTVESQQLIGLPTNPNLFFGYDTFPSESGQAPSDTGPSNTNRAVSLYEGAFHLAMMFLIGEPPAKISVSGNNPAEYSSFLAARSQVAHQMLASYPLTMLFSERLGTIDATGKDEIVQVLTDKMGIATENSQVLQRIYDLRRRDYLSVAEYERILFYDIMTSPGYYDRINGTDMSLPQLKRESVWLSGLLVALNYKRNKWLEIQAALEAVNGL